MHIVSTGMVCPVGLNAEAACAAMRAGISAFEELPYIDNSGEPIMGAVVPGFTLDNRHFKKRLIDMLARAVTECLGKVPQLSTDKIPVLVALAEPDRPGFPSGLAENIINGLQDSLGLNFHPKFSQVISSGHTSGFEALGIAREIMKQHGVSACLVCGVDSYIRAGSLLWLDQHWRLKTEENSDGVIPGEAAAAVLVGMSAATETSSSVELTGIGFAHEGAGILSQEPLLGLGLSEALRNALAAAGIGFHEVDFRVSDVTGESYGFREQMLSLARVMRARREEGASIWHCAEFIGDTGAAAGVCQLVLAFQAFEKGYAPGNNGVCYTSAVSGGRAVAVLGIAVNSNTEYRGTG